MSLSDDEAPELKAHRERVLATRGLTDEQRASALEIGARIIRASRLAERDAAVLSSPADAAAKKINEANRKFWQERQQQIDEMLVAKPSNAVRKALAEAIRGQQAAEPAIRRLIDAAARLELSSLTGPDDAQLLAEAKAALLAKAGELMGPADYLEPMQKAAGNWARTQSATATKSKQREETFERVRLEVEKNPEITIEQAAEKLGLSPGGVKPHLRRAKKGARR